MGRDILGDDQSRRTDWRQQIHQIRHRQDELPGRTSSTIHKDEGARREHRPTHGTGGLTRRSRRLRGDMQRHDKDKEQRVQPDGGEGQETVGRADREIL